MTKTIRDGKGGKGRQRLLGMAKIGVFQIDSEILPKPGNLKSRSKKRVMF